MSTFIFPQYREASFKANGSSWKFSQQENACINNMVEAGFSLMPSATTKDTVRCYYCQIEFTGWEADSDPFFLHLRKITRLLLGSLCLPPKDLSGEDQGD
ncbi:Baculoviral IAP repeat-containing protein 5 [Entomophthora muscae]|uniref:Baculoviral IAP repeat-containing protein 5 n=1 Tax=Entomophthora muscae TaxID=34485 RepID=A0ACC2RSI0_9FUNG|nr:Baculoviral IAP repeat-containing protein 5 [Entomophthora muscae]